MAFLQSSSTLLSTNPCMVYPSRPRRRLEVRCDTSSNPIDRRNMLLGMGGAYTAANFNLAHAAPIPPPDFMTRDSCQDSEIVNKQTGKTLKVNCCPPVPKKPYSDYILPAPPQKPRLRRPAHKLAPNDRQLLKYKEALKKMRELDIKEPDNPLGFKQQAKVHCAYCNAAYPEGQYPATDISVHYSWLFFPFHRWYLYFYERILGSLIGDPNFALPYWNWDNPRGMQIPPIFNDPASPLFDCKRNQDNLPPAIVDLTLGIVLPRAVRPPRNSKASEQEKVRRNLAAVYSEMIGSPVRATDFMGQPYRAGDPIPQSACGGTAERGSHISVHKWVGDPREDFKEDLGNFYSAGNDPLFYCHHANVDRMWSLWKGLKTPVTKDIRDQDYLKSSFLFYDYDQSLVRVTVGDCLDLVKHGHYAYEWSDTPWMRSRPRRKHGRAKTKMVTKEVQTADEVFPLKLTKTTRVLIPKAKKGKADEVLVLQNIVSDASSLIKFNVYVNDDDDDSGRINRAEYAGTFAQLAQNHAHSQIINPDFNLSQNGCNLNFGLQELYENIDIDDEDTSVVVTLYPIYNGQDVIIGGIKIVEADRH